MFKKINSDPSLLRKGILSAPKISKDELKKIIIDYYLKNESLIELEGYEPYIDEDLEEDDLEIARYYVQPIIEFSRSKVHHDIRLDSIYNDFYDGSGDVEEFPLEGFHTLDNGFTFYGFVGAGDETGSYFFIVYYNGNELRGYIPYYGNTYLVDNGIFEGLYEMYHEIDDKYSDWYKTGKVQALSTKERINVNKFIKDKFPYWACKDYYLPETGLITEEDLRKVPELVVYRIVHDYPLTEEDYDWNKVKEDIKTAIILK